MRMLCVILLWGGAIAQGAEVLRVGSSQQIIAVTQDTQSPWKLGDRVCVVEDRLQVECGEVTKATRSAVIVKLDSPNDRIARGFRVRSEASRAAAAPPPEARYAREPAQPQTPPRRGDFRESIDEPRELLNPPPDVAAGNRYRRRRGSRDRSADRFEESEAPQRQTESRRPATQLLSSDEKVERAEYPGWNLSGGISASFAFFFPMLHFQRRLSSYLSLGIMPVYFKASGTTTSVGAIGGVLTLNYYGNEYFRGFWGQIGGGVYGFSASNTTTAESATTPVFLATAGWRGYWDLGLNVGLGAGLQYIGDPKFTLTTVKAVNVQPVVVLDVGFSF